MLRIAVPFLLLSAIAGCGPGGVLDLDPTTARTGAEVDEDGGSSDADDRDDDDAEDRDDDAEDRDDDAEDRDDDDRDEGVCEERCRNHATDLYDGCVDAGRDAAACARWARGELASCIEDHCDDDADDSDDSDDSDDADDSVCEDRCGTYARGLYEDCLDSGRDEAVCARWARSEYGICVDEHC